MEFKRIRVPRITCSNSIVSTKSSLYQLLFRARFRVSNTRRGNWEIGRRRRLDGPRHDRKPTRYGPVYPDMACDGRSLTLAMGHPWASGRTGVECKAPIAGSDRSRNKMLFRAPEGSSFYHFKLNAWRGSASERRAWQLFQLSGLSTNPYSVRQFAIARFHDYFDSRDASEQLLETGA